MEELVIPKVESEINIAPPLEYDDPANADETEEEEYEVRHWTYVFEISK